MCIYKGHVYIFTPNMKFLCLTMWLGGLYTENNTDSDTKNDPDNDRQSMIVKALWLINQMSQKSKVSTALPNQLAQQS